VHVEQHSHIRKVAGVYVEQHSHIRKVAGVYVEQHSQIWKVGIENVNNKAYLVKSLFYQIDFAGRQTHLRHVAYD
jgi:hypothetical protein